jgi:hypothetical protein
MNKMDHTPEKKVQFKLPPSIKEERKKILKPWCGGLCGTCEDSAENRQYSEHYIAYMARYGRIGKKVSQKDLDDASKVQAAIKKWSE